jgi:DNA-directed RNA polymerase subunit RPC12/RpoP
MPIEFLCPECAEAIRVQTTVAGLHTRCPNCLVTVPVPAAGAERLPKRWRHRPQEGDPSLPTVTPASALHPPPPPAPSPEAAAPPAATPLPPAATPAPPPPVPKAAPLVSGSKTITFRCPECRTRQTVHDDLIGLHTRCPGCRGNILVPAVSEGPGWFGWVWKLLGLHPPPPAPPGG